MYVTGARTDIHYASPPYACLIFSMCTTFEPLYLIQFVTKCYGSLIILKRSWYRTYLNWNCCDMLVTS